ncbi:hypothetical protein N658DRAFT_522619 [Parathielavia hyrcaniae]|uniref:Uncharacterized protein n=1 Tax=Parathielavia hyrcaniae TaxID=113614 RepID=A0AAN6Q473_9PEZI|nr:hypothetical protein N658DRAFT_522619 [Parathielavia hyrcaniae]
MLKLSTYFLASIFQDFYEWPLERRLQLLACKHNGVMDHRVVPRIFRPVGGLCPSDLGHLIDSDATGRALRGQTLSQLVAGLYFRSFMSKLGCVLWHGHRPFQDTRENCRDWEYREAQLLLRNIALIASHGDICAINKPAKWKNSIARWDLRIGKVVLGLLVDKTGSV